MGEILGAVVAMALFGYFVAWIIRKISKIAELPSYVIGVSAMTVVGAWLYSANGHYSFAEAWVIYAIGGTVALPIMIVAERRKQAAICAVPVQDGKSDNGMVRIVAIWLFGLFAGGLAGALVGVAIVRPTNDTAFLVVLSGFVCGLCAFACARLWLAAPAGNSN